MSLCSPHNGMLNSNDWNHERFDVQTIPNIVVPFYRTPPRLSGSQMKSFVEPDKATCIDIQNHIGNKHQTCVHNIADMFCEP